MDEIWDSIEKGYTGSFRYETNVMDKIWYRNPSKSEVIGHCSGDEKTE